MIGAMLATRSTPALPQRTLLSPVELEDDDGTTSWKRFCREQGRLAAELFADRMRAYKEDHSTTTQSDAAMNREFSASMCEHLAALTTTVAEAHGDMSAPSLVSLNSTLTANSVPEPAATATSPSRQGHKHWWQFFTRGKNKRTNISSVKRRKHSAPPPDREVVIDQMVSQLNLNDGWERGRMSWTRCRLVLAKVQGNHQLEIYSPYKNTTPKTSLFCFLIEEVRSSSSLEVADSDSCFVIKCQNYGEYVFDVSCESAKNQWMSEIERCASSTTAQHMPMSASMNMIGNGNIRASPLAHSGLQSSAATVQRATSPLLESYRASPTQYPRSNSQQTDEPALIDISTLNPNLPYLSSSSRNNGGGASQRRRVRSLYLDNYNVQTDGARAQQRTTPASTSSSASPPLPRRGTCPRSTVAALTSPPRELPPLPRDLPPLPPRPLPSPPSSPSREERAASSNSNHELGSPSSSSSSALHPISIIPVEDTDSPEASPPIENQMNSNSSSSSLVHPESSDAANSESLNRMLSSELSFSSERGLIRQRSLDSSTAHATETSNIYRIDTMEQDGARSDSTFSSAGNLHEVIQDHALSPSALSTPESPITDTASETSSIPLYIETNSSSTADLQLPSYTRHPYQSWATNSTDLDNLRTLSQHPWFHGLISRANATLLVLGNGTNGSGQYLVRQSESREGDFVLTFNCHNRAKHLRLTLDANGCTIQHLWFEDIVTMLDYFKTHPISLETVPMGDEISLTTYIDRSASDTFRTTTVVNVERIQRTPPRRSRSIHVTMTQSASERGSPTHTLSSSAHHSSWRQLFTRQRSSSSHSVRAHATVQRRHSENAGSILDVQARARLSGRDRGSGNRYVWRNY